MERSGNRPTRLARETRRRRVFLECQELNLTHTQREVLENMEDTEVTHEDLLEPAAYSEAEARDTYRNRPENRTEILEHRLLSA